MLKYILILCLFALNLFSLDAISSIPKNEKEVLNSIVEKLKLPSDTKTKELVYDKISSYFTDGWSAHWTTNSTAANSKIESSKTQICDVSIYNNNRVANCTFVYFQKEKQLFITVKQYVEGESSKVLELYNERKNDKEYTLENETNNYAYFNQKGYMTYETYHIESPAGMIVYESSFLLDID